MSHSAVIKNEKLGVKAVLNSLVLIFLFIVPYTVIASASATYKTFFDIALLLGYVLVALYLNRQLLGRKYLSALLFSCIFSFFGIINQLVNNYISFYNIIAPFAAFFGYVYVINHPLNRKLFNWLMIGNYIFFYLIYYSKNPINFFISEVELDVDFFTNTSSNLIPAVLIINLYICDVLDYVKFGKSNKKFILAFAVFNLILILLQRSRAGVIVSLIYLLIKIYEYNRKLFFAGIAIITTFIVINFDLLMLYIELAGGISDDAGYAEDARGIALNIFFSNMSIKSFFFGYGKELMNLVPAATQALFLNIWNFQGLFFLIILGCIVLARFIGRHRRMLPLNYFLPILVYSVFEGFFLPNYWDFVIYFLLFYKISTPIKQEAYLNSFIDKKLTKGNNMAGSVPI